jgi:hypothetical protein
MSTTKLPMTSGRFTSPTTLTLEASSDVIFEQHLDTWAGEHYDRLENVIRVDVERDVVRFTTTRSHAAWKRGECNAGRGTFAFPHEALEAIWIADTAGGDWIAD